MLATLLPLVLFGALRMAAFHATNAHIRSNDAYVLSLIREGESRSEAFSDLVAQLGSSDLVVYVRVRRDTSDTDLRFLGASSEQRYVEIAFSRDTGRLQLIARLGHELEHALEVAESPDVRSAAAFAYLYERIGIAHTTMLSRRFETQRAVARERQVFRELTSRATKDNVLAGRQGKPQQNGSVAFQNGG